MSTSKTKNDKAVTGINGYIKGKEMPVQMLRNGLIRSWARKRKKK
jgi:hypothetical protein